MSSLGFGLYPTHPGEVLKDELEEHQSYVSCLSKTSDYNVWSFYVIVYPPKTYSFVS